jgi:predicted nucleic acid-binding protein
VIIPEAVYQEITGSVPGLPGALAIQELQWIVSQPVQNDAVVRALQGELDHGEAEAIALAVELQAGLILIDERRARAIAARMGLNVVGVLGVLVEAKHKALVPLLKPILDSLIAQVGFWVSPQLYERVLQVVGEGWTRRTPHARVGGDGHAAQEVIPAQARIQDGRSSCIIQQEECA